MLYIFNTQFSAQGHPTSCRSNQPLKSWIHKWSPLCGLQLQPRSSCMAIYNVQLHDETKKLWDIQWYSINSKIRFNLQLLYHILLEVQLHFSSNDFITIIQQEEYYCKRIVLVLHFALDVCNIGTCLHEYGITFQLSGLCLSFHIFLSTVSPARK